MNYVHEIVRTMNGQLECLLGSVGRGRDLAAIQAEHEYGRPLVHSSGRQRTPAFCQRHRKPAFYTATNAGVHHGPEVRKARAEKAVRIRYAAEDWFAMKDRGADEQEPGYERPIQVILFQVCEHYGYHAGQIVLMTKWMKDVEGLSGYKH